MSWALKWAGTPRNCGVPRDLFIWFYLFIVSDCFRAFLGSWSGEGPPIPCHPRSRFWASTSSTIFRPLNLYFNQSQSQKYYHVTMKRHRLYNAIFHTVFSTSTLTLYGRIGTAEQRTIIQQYGDWYTGRWWVGCYIWYSEEGIGWAAAQPSSLLAVPNATAHPSTPVYQLHIIRCGVIIASALIGLMANHS